MWGVGLMGGGRGEGGRLCCSGRVQGLTRHAHSHTLLSGLTHGSFIHRDIFFSRENVSQFFSKFFSEFPPKF